MHVLIDSQITYETLCQKAPRGISTAHMGTTANRGTITMNNIIVMLEL